ncbi:MAG: hypothetical protein JSS07_10715 [Proteobacteria bacterium]|nr:hypothetical protein [Pseudomonadota bacterium]
MKEQESSCDKILTKKEWSVLQLKFMGQINEKIFPSTKEVYHWIAELGGYIGRRNDNPPGVISLWRGWIRFMDLIKDYDTFCG